MDTEKLRQAIRNYKEELSGIPFARVEQNALMQLDEESQLLEMVQVALDSSLELNRLVEQCPNSIYVVDVHGNTIRVNQAFEVLTGLPRERVIDNNVAALEEDGTFSASINMLTLREKRKINILQVINDRQILVTGMPIRDGQGRIYQSVSNAITVQTIQDFFAYMDLYRDAGQPAQVDIISESPAMKYILHTASVIAQVDSIVLITGESGVGKGVIAHFLHEQSPRRDQAMVEINCGAIPETLLESELFGYESGAFTGANRKGKRGLIEQAEGGTLFLDEISEMPMAMQVKLLRFLQTGHYYKIGATKESYTDVRIIAATNKDLPLLISQGRFRADLYYRLNVVPLHIPPLRERPEDILPAAQYFAAQFREKYRKNFELDPEILESIRHYDWPGNLRELENAIEREVVTGGSYHGRYSGAVPGAPLFSSIDAAGKQMALSEALEEYEAELVRAAYARGGNSYRVAEILGISQPSASRKIREYVKKGGEKR